MAKKKSAKSSKRRKHAVKDLPAKSAEVKGGILYSATLMPNPPPISPTFIPAPPPI